MAEGKRIHVAFAQPGGADWSAGSIFYSNVFRALKSLDDETRPKISIICQDGENENETSALVDGVITFSAQSRSKTPIARVLRNSANRLLSPMDRPLRDAGVDFLFTTHLPENWAAPSIPVVAWIPDFQHLRIPDFFSQSDIDARNCQFLHLLQKAKTVVVTSKDVRNDLANFFPAYIEKCKVLNFATTIPAEMLQCQPKEIADWYKLPERFFYLPNQFWKHKNHLLVLDALEKAVRECPDLTVVATGNLRDYRHPNFLDELLQLISTKKLRDNFIVLGLIPRPHTFALMRGCVAVLQPSLFEGLSMTVAESAVVGKQVIASDIDVLRELASAGTVFFAPDDSAQLADLLLKHHLEFAGVSDDDYKTAMKNSPQLLRRFADSLMSAFS